MSFAYTITLSYAGHWDGVVRGLRVLDGEMTTDQGWTPYGQARFTVPLADWNATGMTGLARSRITVRVSSNTHSGPGLFDGASQYVDRVFMLQGVELDYAAGTAQLTLATSELELLEEVNTGAPWMPFTSGSSTATNILTALLNKIGSATNAAQSAASQSVNMNDIEPWQPGETAWDWYDRVRLRARASYRINTAGDFRLYGEPDSSRGDPPATFEERRREYVPSEYADSVAITWRWTDAGVEQERRDHALGTVGDPPIRRHLELSRDERPIDGYAQRLVDRLYDLRYVDHVTMPLTYELAGLVVHPPGWQSLRYSFTDEPTVQATIRTAT